uniref:Uncharacterized protein n=1 Tax=Ditylenchus dipsaci TaxID=166011 RepID=A0A915D969_9BILA
MGTCGLAFIGVSFSLIVKFLLAPINSSADCEIEKQWVNRHLRPILEDKNVYPTEPAIESVMPVWPISKNPVAPELAARMPERQETIRIVNEMKRTVWGDYAKNNDDVKWAYHPVAAYCPNCEERVVTVVDHKWEVTRRICSFCRSFRSSSACVSSRCASTRSRMCSTSVRIRLMAVASCWGHMSANSSPAQTKMMPFVFI